MKLSILIAIRYLFAKKSKNIINIISWISVICLTTSALALLVVLSVFGGLHSLMGSLFSTFDPDLKVEPTKGKIINLTEIELDKLSQIEGVECYTLIVEDFALFRFGARQSVGQVMGVDSMFNKVSAIDSIIVEGIFRTKSYDMYEGVVGYALADQLGIRLNFITPLSIFAPERTGNVNMARIDRSFRSEYLQPVGLFLVNQIEYDGIYVITDIEQAQRLFDYQPYEINRIGIKIDHEISSDKIQNAISELLGSDFILKNREEQHDTFYKMMKIEKFVAYLILSFIIMISVFNVIGTLSLLIFEKRESIKTLRSMGADRQLINRIFIFEGWFISLAGAICGIILGIILIWLQQTFGLVRFGAEGNYVVDSYPVLLKLSDIILVFITVSTMGLVAAWYPVKVLVKKHYLS
ncbi:MAG: FtsX-like permease family protein [Marinilabiliaceae bacterium]|nr:FtsX-like permease family protein [Marinilabiliaceae bacterium]